MPALAPIDLSVAVATSVAGMVLLRAVNLLEFVAAIALLAVVVLVISLPFGFALGLV
jgi:hypothetical protein